MDADLAFRASEMPIAFRCAASVRRPSLPIADSSDAADLGLAAHEALRPLAEGAGLPWDAIPSIAARWSVDPEELRMLAATANKLWPSVSDSFVGALTEVELSVEIAPGVRLTGHVDLLAVSGGVARAGDWKSGRKDHDYSHQMRAYGALILLDDPTLTEVTVTILWIRDGDIENYTMTRADAVAWRDELLATVVNWDGTFRPGHHCGWCKRSHECEARSAMVRRDVSALLDSEVTAGLAGMPAEQKLSLYRKANLVIQYAERVKKELRADVEQHGDIVTADGRLTIDPELRRELDPLKAWPVLEAEGFGDDDFAQVVDVSISRVERLVAKRAGRGKGATAVRALAEKLKAAGAVKTREIRKLTEKR